MNTFGGLSAAQLNSANRERSSLVTASELKSEDPGFDPLVGQGDGQVVVFFCPSESTLEQTCLCLTPLHVYGMHPNVCAC